MELKTLETKCPICGSKNAPDKFTAKIGTVATVKAEYYCTGKIRRIFRRAKSCHTQYRVILRDDAAEQVINEISVDGGTSYGAREGKEG